MGLLSAGRRASAFLSHVPQCRTGFRTVRRSAAAEVFARCSMSFQFISGLCSSLCISPASGATAFTLFRFIVFLFNSGIQYLYILFCAVLFIFSLSRCLIIPCACIYTGQERSGRWKRIGNYTKHKEIIRIFFRGCILLFGSVSDDLAGLAMCAGSLDKPERRRYLFHALTHSILFRQFHRFRFPRCDVPDRCFFFAA